MVNEILAIACISNALLAFAVCCLIRLCKHRLNVLASVVEQEDWSNEILQPLRQTLLSFAEPSWTPPGRYMSLATVIPKVEEGDREQTIGTLLAQIASECKLTFDEDIKLANLEQFVKSVYRLQPSLRFDDATMVDILSQTVDRVNGSVLLAKTVGRVELVKTDARVDEKTMWPLSSGLRVKQPFGLILKTESGEVLSRAKAQCH